MTHTLVSAACQFGDRLAFLLLCAAWTLVRGHFARRYRDSHQVVVASRASRADRVLVAATGVAFLLPAANFVLAGPLRAELPLGDLVRFAGAVIALLAVALFLWTHRTLGDNWSIGLEVRAGHSLVDRGPYRFVRHPMYLAMALCELGLGILAADALLLVLSPLPFWLLVLTRVAREEELMHEHLGDAYSAYRARTKRLIPWLY